ncbi:hypothetical protein [Streptomyces decoyicus]|uniref:hypothetical protein n=1 Tax=Streptomyces decoyicus TaxID=249567 RepID=UPI000A4371B9|nr:hypothetical protein [Streptomyces decoyicus]QZY13986.1 hypothetical protein K7C20_00895 [Streptomyces decoyicus]
MAGRYPAVRAFGGGPAGRPGRDRIAYRRRRAFFSTDASGAHKQTLKAFAQQLGEIIPGLRKALIASIVSHRAVGGGWS